MDQHQDEISQKEVIVPENRNGQADENRSESN